MKTAVNKTFPLGVLSAGLLEFHTASVRSCVCTYSSSICMLCMQFARLKQVRTQGDECVWLASKWGSGSIWSIIQKPPLFQSSLSSTSQFCSLPFVPSHGLIWSRTQFLNSTPWVLLIRPSARRSQAPERAQCTRRMAENQIPRDNEVHL